MLAPHHRENPELGEVGFAAENFFDLLELFRRQAVFRHQLRSNFGLGGRGARHRQRTLTNVTRDTTRPRTPSEESLTLVLSLQKGRGEKVGGRALIAHEIQRELPLLFVRGEGKGEESTTADFL